MFFLNKKLHLLVSEIYIQQNFCKTTEYFNICCFKGTRTLYRLVEQWD